jgi:anaerobic selenocysteine-containing dehydrogenase
VLRTASGRIEVAPEPILDDLGRLGQALEQEREALVLVGRRDLRSNNSWMHNVEVLARGPERCTLMIHPDDARRAEVDDGGTARVRSRAGSVVLKVEVTDSIMPGVVSIPHGYGHDHPSARQRVAAAHAGINVNLLVDEREVDALSGNAVLNGVPVSVGPEAG